MIKDHIKVSQKFDPEDSYCEDVDRWIISESGNTIEGGTIMDNFDMRWFLRQIGIKDEHIKWDD